MIFRYIIEAYDRTEDKSINEFSQLIELIVFKKTDREKRKTEKEEKK